MSDGTYRIGNSGENWNSWRPITKDLFVSLWKTRHVRDICSTHSYEVLVRRARVYYVHIDDSESIRRHYRYRRKVKFSKGGHFQYIIKRSWSWNWKSTVNRQPAMLSRFHDFFQRQKNTLFTFHILRKIKPERLDSKNWEEKKSDIKTKRGNIPSIQIEFYLRMRAGVRRLGARCAVEEILQSLVLSCCII